MMTTMAALLGALPLAMGTGVGSELRRPLGIAIVGGLILSQLLTLYTTPVVYLAFDRLARRVAARSILCRRIPEVAHDGFRYEYLGAVHPAARRHDSADDRGHARRSGRLPVSSRRGAAAGGVSHDQRLRQPAGRQPGNHGDVGRGSARTPVRAHRGRDRNDVHEHSRFHAASRPQFELSRDIDGAARDVQAAINAARADLPAALPNNPTYRKVNPADAPILILALTSDIVSRGQMYDAASSILQQKLSQVEGVGQVTVGGGSLPAVRVDLNPTALNKYGIGLGDVRRVLAETNVNRPKGQLTNDSRTWEIQTNDQLHAADDYCL